MLTDLERSTLALALDALLPPQGSFPWPSATGTIDDFLLKVVPAEGTYNPEWPGLDAAALGRLLDRLAGALDLDSMTDALSVLERESPVEFQQFWSLAVYGYYSRPEVTEAVAREHAPRYHGAPLPEGYAHLLAPWDVNDPLQYPQHPRGAYTATADVQRVDLERLRVVADGEASA
jgi:hypothetical protein